MGRRVHRGEVSFGGRNYKWSELIRQAVIGGGAGAVAILAVIALQQGLASL